MHIPLHFFAHAHAHAMPSKYLMPQNALMPSKCLRPHCVGRSHRNQVLHHSAGVPPLEEGELDDGLDGRADDGVSKVDGALGGADEICGEEVVQHRLVYVHAEEPPALTHHHIKEVGHAGAGDPADGRRREDPAGVRPPALHETGGLEGDGDGLLEDVCPQGENPPSVPALLGGRDDHLVVPGAVGLVGDGGGGGGGGTGLGYRFGKTGKCSSM
mmetsp:Transcript_66515/g.210546  ORF Transcript_66515/g.210546 Transcript_66515/m.210546 type:complete len:214 (+) Transcript_66515:313-954(+)